MVFALQPNIFEHSLPFSGRRQAGQELLPEFLVELCQDLLILKT
ncbi:hypothetical protein AWU68_2278 [Corynebacterium simulans]|nr:hypothetical protein AWU68_2278 [Corynebacterium simulans]